VVELRGRLGLQPESRPVAGIEPQRYYDALEVLAAALLEAVLLDAVLDPDPQPASITPAARATRPATETVSARTFSC
jgi:hypothetical protein